MIFRLVIVAWLAVLASTSSVSAQPWAAGVSDTQKVEAKKHLEEGNVLFFKRDFEEALEKYREALASWDHPAIRFNVVRCLIQLGQPLEASDNLELALKYGAAPLEDAVYTEALSYQKLLAEEITDLALTCSQDGVVVTLDGKQVIEKCPGQIARRLKRGAHVVVGEKKGFLTSTSNLKLVGGDHERADIKLVPLSAAAKVTHRWPTWMPWVVFGSGIGMAAFGGVLRSVAANEMATHDNAIASQCATVECPAGTLEASKATAERNGKIGVAMISVGTAAAVTGAVLLYLNRGKTVYEKQKIDVSLTVGGAAVSFTRHF